MAAHDMAVLDGIKRKSLVMRGEALRKPLADDLKRAVGHAIDRAIVLSGLTKQDASFRMGYQDQSALARWIAGVETPQFARLFEVTELRVPLVQALAEMTQSDGIEIVTEIRLRRRA